MAFDLREAIIFDSVRRAIDLRITDRLLPDEVIEDQLFLASALRRLLARDPDAETYDPDGTAAEQAKRAAALRALSLLTAAELCPQVPVLLSRAAGDVRLQFQGWDPWARAAYLRAKAAEELASYLEPDGVTAPGVQFALAHGYRGR